MTQTLIYLLSVGELNSGLEAGRLCELAMRNMDAHRLEKVQRLKPGNKQNLAIGAGLLLQLAVRQEQGIYPRCLTVSEVLDILGERGAPVQIEYQYGACGKPDFADGPVHFNLSHSGQYVCCAVSEEEVGIDIQSMRPLKNMRLAERFFSRRENDMLQSCGNDGERKELFYRIWVRKEAYAKLTGEGIVTAVGKDVTDAPGLLAGKDVTDAPGLAVGKDVTGIPRTVIWRDLDGPEGYCMALCHYGQGPSGK